jgi:membrane fusion protein (multidrug efflux system)
MLRLGGFGVVALSILLAACSEQSSQASANAKPAANAPEVGVVVLRPQPVTITSELPGRVNAFLFAEVRPQVDGIIKERLFDEGAEIKAGTVLYKIDAALYEAAFASATAALEKSEAMLPSLASKAERYAVLGEKNIAAQTTVEDATAAYAQGKAAVAVAKAELETARIKLAYTQIKAPISGRIGKSSVTAGALVTASQATALATIRAIDQVYVDIVQSSTNMLKLRRALSEGSLEGQASTLPVRLILEDGTPYPHAGKLHFAEIKVDEGTGTFTMRAVFPNPERLLLPGMYVRAVIEEGRSTSAFLVPQRGVSRNAKGEATALFVRADGKVEERVLVITRAIGPNWLVEGGVAEGDRLVVEGTMKVRRGQAATAVEMKVDDATGTMKRVDAGPATTSIAAASSRAAE